MEAMPNAHRQEPAGEGPVALGRMAAVQRQVEAVVEDVDGRRRRAEGDEGEQAGQHHAGVEIFVRQNDRHGDQAVLQPLVHAQHLQDGLEGRLGRFDQLAAMLGLPARRAAVRRHHGRLARRVEDFEVVPAVAIIVEAGIAIGGDKGGALAVRSQVFRPVRRQHGIEDAEMRGDLLGKLARRAGGQDELAAGGMRGLQTLHHLLAIGQRGRIDVDAPGYLQLQRRRPPGEPERHQEQVERILAQEQEQPLPQQIGRDQRPIEINRQGNCILVGPGVHQTACPAPCRTA
jgi:hypothetical protein